MPKQGHTPDHLSAGINSSEIDSSGIDSTVLFHSPNSTLCQSLKKSLKLKRPWDPQKTSWTRTLLPEVDLVDVEDDKETQPENTMKLQNRELEKLFRL